MFFFVSISCVIFLIGFLCGVHYDDGMDFRSIGRGNYVRGRFVKKEIEQVKYKPGYYWVKGRTETKIAKYDDIRGGFTDEIGNLVMSYWSVLGPVNPEPMKIEREPGFYKVKHSAFDWEVAHYFGDDVWSMTNSVGVFKDSEFQEIGDKVELP